MTTPRFSVGQMTTIGLSFEEDLAVYSAAGAQGIGIDGSKLGDSRRNLEQFKASGLEATFCFPVTPSVLPIPGWSGAPDPADRVEEICQGMERLAAFEPAACACVTGPQGSYEAGEARELAVAGLKQVARRAADMGMTVAIEPVHSSIKDRWSFLTTIPDTVELLAEIDEPNMGMVFDVWHLWDTPDLLDHVREHAQRFIGAHVDDWRDPTRSWCDRVLPGDGIADVRGIFRALDEGGFDGWFELEIFSDDGRFGNDFPDSLWKLDPLELVRTGRAQFMHLWESRDDLLYDRAVPAPETR